MSVADAIRACWPALLALLVATAAGEKSQCAKLEDTYSDPEVPGNRWITTFGRQNNLTLLWGARAPSRAASALLAAVLRAGVGLRYKGVRLQQGNDTLCKLAEQYTTFCEGKYTGFLADLSTAWDPESPCAAVLECDETYRGGGLRQCGLAGGRLQPGGPGAAPVQLGLFARLAPALRGDPVCENLDQWEFYTNETAVRHCGFLHPDNITVGKTTKERWLYTSCSKDTERWCVAVVCSNEARAMASTLVARAKQAGLALALVPLESDAGPRSQRYALLKDMQLSLLLLDYDMESINFTFVQPPPAYCHPSQPCDYLLDSNQSLRVADYHDLKTFAPRIVNAIQKFKPNTSALQEILELEATGQNIEEAACQWATDNSEVFRSWFAKEENDTYYAAVFLCKSDSNNDQYMAVSRLIEKYENQTKFSLNFLLQDINCFDKNELGKLIDTAMRNDISPRIAGVIVAGEGIPDALHVANRTKLALVAYDMFTSEVQPGPMSYAAIGSVADLAVAFGSFLKRHNWNRVAIVSETTSLSVSFYNALISKNTLKHHNVYVSKNSIEATLYELYQLDARIFIVNMGAKNAAKMLCSAIKLDLTKTTKFVWILREWDFAELDCPDSQSISYLSISFWWRGDEHLALANSSTSKHLRRELSRKLLGSDPRPPRDLWPPRAASLANAMLILSRSFKKFMLKHLELHDDLHGQDVDRIFSETFQNFFVYGVTQELRYEGSTLEQPLVFVERWEGGVRRKLLAAWAVGGGEVPVVLHQPPSDGAATPCTTTSVGPAFAPTCLDGAWVALAFTLLLATNAFFMACRARLKRLAKHDLAIRRQIQEQRQRAIADLAAYVIDSDMLELGYVLGTGRFGTVRFATLQTEGQNSRAIAAKAIVNGSATGDEREFLREALLLASLDHRHIIRFLGVCLSEDSLLVLMEHAFFGDLLRYLRARRHLIENARENNVTLNFEEELIHVSPSELTRLTREAAAALAYLAHKRIVHRDVRAANCLVDERRILKLADFGLARELGGAANDDEQEYLSWHAMIPVAWMAPESLTHGVFSTASDVWSLAVLMLEIVTLGEHPFGSCSTRDVLKYVSDGGCPPLSQDATPQMRGLAMACWRRVAAERPSAATIVDYLASNTTVLVPALLPPPPVPRFVSSSSSDATSFIIDDTCIPSYTDSGYSDYT